MLRSLGVRAVLAPVVVIAVALSTGGWVADRVAADPRPPLASALDALPTGTVVAGFTDWSAIRAGLGLGDASTARARVALSDDASLRDLTTRSVLGASIDEMHSLYGWSAADVEWESYGQAAGGAALVARLAGSVSFDDVQKRLRSIGYTRSGETWVLGDEGRRTVGQGLAAALGTLAVLPDERLVVAVSEEAYAPTVLATVRHERASLLSRRPVAELATALAGSDTALLQARQEGCRSTAVGDSDPDVAAQAAAAVARAGRLAAPVFSGRGLVDGSPRQDIRFVAAFDSPAEAAEQLRVRRALASGPFIGQSGRVEDSLDLVGATSSGGTATLRFDLDPDRGAYMAGEGPLLFASCPR